MTGSSVDDLTKLKDLVISHVAKDVLMLTENVDDLKEKTGEISALLKQIHDSSEGYFDNLSKKLIDLLVEMEGQLAKVAEARTSQITMTVSDNVEKLLNDKFKNYHETIDKALADFGEVNKQAVSSLNSEFNSASEAINGFKQNDSKKPSSGGKLIVATIVLQLAVLAVVGAGLFIR